MRALDPLLRQYIENVWRDCVSLFEGYELDEARLCFLQMTIKYFDGWDIPDIDARLAAMAVLHEFNLPAPGEPR